ncbi:MAG TPA: hypothetical protein VHJ78_06290 [Actinomycetota bacterium]|nr:hypothetical protein [Actinomycetota bacterium]
MTAPSRYLRGLAITAVAVVALGGCASVPLAQDESTPEEAARPAGSATGNPAQPSSPRAAVPQGPAVSARQVALGQTFHVGLGEMVGIAGEDLVLTFVQLLSDNRCQPGVQCIVAGNARIVVSVGTDSDPPASLTLNTDQQPRTGKYLDRTVELVGLSRGASPSASLIIR